MKIKNKRFEPTELYHSISPISRHNYKKYQKKAQSKFDYSNKDITILAPNCAAGEMYSVLGIPFLSPTIDVSINRKHFLLLCSHLREYIEAPSKFYRFREMNTPVLSIKPENLPEIRVGIGRHHAYTAEEAVAAWEKRKTRVNFDKVYVVCDDQNMTDEDMEIFRNLKCKNKIMFTANKDIADGEYIVYVGDKMLQKYQYKGMDGVYNFQHFWDFAEFLNKK